MLDQACELRKSHGLTALIDRHVQVDEDYNGFCYVYDGSGIIGGTRAGEQQALVMGKGASFAPASETLPTSVIDATYQ